MVKKLLKHELVYYSRSLLPIYALVLAIAGLSRIIQFFETDNTLYNILFSTSVGTFVIGILCCLILTAVFTIVRYYRNLFSAEGYLTFTLPVTPVQLLWTKLLTATVMQVISFIIVLAATCIITAGDVLTEIVRAVVFLLKSAPAELKSHYWLFAIELVVLVLAALVYQSLLLYACITVGQMANKNRVLAAVGVYIGYYVITQIVGTVFVIISALLPWGWLISFVDAHPLATAHIAIWAGVLFNAILSTIYFVITHLIMRHKLNLE